MAKKLGHDDGRAVDLMLNGELTVSGSDCDGRGGLGADDGSAEVVSRGHGNFRGRLESVERVLRLLNEMPSAEPPPVLAARTLRRSDEVRLSPGSASSQGRSPQHSQVGGSRPQA